MARLKGFRKLTSVDDSLEMFFSQLQFERLRPISIPLNLALDRVLAEDFVAETDLPRFNRSAVDGYAVKAEETVGATQFKPKTFELTENSVIGNKQARQVWTGNPMPKGSDAAVMIEDTRRVKDQIEVWTALTPAKNVSVRGEDIQKGEVATQAGTRLKPQHLGLLGALGGAKISVFKKPKIAILATGNELVKIGSKLGKNQIFEINKLVLSALCSELGAEPLDLGIARDDVDEILAKLKSGLEKADVVVTSGGTSVGGSDLVPEAANTIGNPGVIVHGIAMRPGMPTALAIVDQKPIVILPGNPVAAIIGFEVFARPLICRILGLKTAEARHTIQANVTKNIATTLGRKNFVRVNVFQERGEVMAEPISARGSSMISTMTRSNGYVVVPENREGLEKGEIVTVFLFDNMRVAP